MAVNYQSLEVTQSIKLTNVFDFFMYPCCVLLQYTIYQIENTYMKGGNPEKR